jgi:hypothetical protein
MSYWIVENTEIIAGNKERMEELITRSQHYTIISHTISISNFISLYDNFHNSGVQNRREREKIYMNLYFIRNNARSTNPADDSNILK